LSCSAGIVESSDILEAFLMGCNELKAPKIIQICMAALHRLIDNAAVNEVGHTDNDTNDVPRLQAETDISQRTYRHTSMERHS
jgi:hypothetical protein